MRIDPHQGSLEPSDRSLLRSAFAVVVTRVLGAIAALGTTVVIGRTLGTFWAGTYFIAVAFIGIAVAIGRLGLGLPTMRLASVAIARSDWPRVRGIARKSLLLGFVGAAFFSIVILLAAPLVASLYANDSLQRMLRITGTGIIPMVLLLILARLLMSVRHAAFAEFVQRLGPNVGILVGVLALSRWFGGYSVALAFSIAYWAAFLGALAVWWFLMPSHVGTARVSAIDLLRPAVPLLFASSIGLIVVWLDILMIGVLLNSSEAGVYGAATRVAGVVAFVLVAASTVMGPRFARLYERNDLGGLAAAFRASATWTALAALGVSIVLVLFASQVMGLFGNEFRTGQTALTILVVGQFANSATGLLGLVLAMSGRERRLLQAAFLAGALNVGLNLVLIPRLGIDGAALATAASLVMLNTATLVFVKVDLGIVLVRSRTPRTEE